MKRFRLSSLPDHDSKDDDIQDVELDFVPRRSKYSSLSCESDASTLIGIGESKEIFATPSSSKAVAARIKKASRNAVRSHGWKYLRMGTGLDDPSTTNHTFRGWRKAVIAAAIVTGFVLFINTIFAIVVSSKYAADDGVGVIYTGSCTLVKRWDTAIHLLINVLGTILLAASSFTMQCLSSPTRSEVDAAHAKRRSLEIGIPSFTNLFYMKGWKAAIWWSLCLSTLPIHLLWNSTVFSTLGANEASYVIVTEDFLNGASFVAPDFGCLKLTSNDTYTPQMLLDNYRASNLVNISVAECHKAYSAAFVTEYKNFLAVTKTVDANTRLSPGCAFAPGWTVNLTEYYGLNATTVYPYPTGESGTPEPLNNGSSVLGYGYIGTNQYLSWLCAGYDEWLTQPSNIYYAECTADFSTHLLETNGTWYLRPDDTMTIPEVYFQSYAIDYCLAERVNVDDCQLQYVSYILYVVIVCNIVKLASMCTAAYWLWDLKEPIFATVGDAVASYMNKPDETTAGWCLMDLKKIKTWRKTTSRPVSGHEYSRKRKARLFSATTKTRWFTTILICTSYLCVGFVMLKLAIDTGSSYQPSLSSIWKLGLGDINSNMTLGVDGKSGGRLVIDIIIANSFQLALSTTYFLYNSLYTAQCGALEWASYASSRRRPLRVTFPRGDQRSTYYLHLPYKYGIPLTAFLMLLHFFISQSVFLARVQWYTSMGPASEDDFISDVGFSPVAILITCCIGSALILAQIMHSFRPIDNRVPFHGNSSAVISAMCHCDSTATTGDDVSIFSSRQEGNIAAKKVMWGVTRENDSPLEFKNGMAWDWKNDIEMPPSYDQFEAVGFANDDTVEVADPGAIGHCSFTAKVVDLPVSGKRYQ